jgi:hypothetical protein
MPRHEEDLGSRSQASTELTFSGCVYFCQRRLGDKTNMSQRSEEYWAKARDCRVRAEKARDPSMKEQFEDMANQWQRMAEEAEKHDR